MLQFKLISPAGILQTLTFILWQTLTALFVGNSVTMLVPLGNWRTGPWFFKGKNEFLEEHFFETIQ